MSEFKFTSFSQLKQKLLENLMSIFVSKYQNKAIYYFPSFFNN